jgi:hypothetical protein
LSDVRWFDRFALAAAGVMERPEVQQTLEKARTAAPAPLQDSIDKLSLGTSGRQSTSAETVDAVTPPTSDASGPAGRTLLCRTR